MKELSIKEKAERYDELLKKLRKAKVDNNVCDERYCCVIDDIVPELKESEDEKIRKEIINYLEPQGDCCVNKERWIAWLEKQGEKWRDWSYEEPIKCACWDLDEINDINYILIPIDVAVKLFDKILLELKE